MLQMEEDAGVHWAPAEESGTSALHQDETLDAFDCEFPEDDLDADENEEHDTPTADEEKDRCEAERGEGRDGEPRSRRRGRTRRGAAGAGPVDQAPASAPSHKPILTSGRHKPLRRRAQHPHTQSRARRRHGAALLSACRDVLCSVSPWGLSCVRMLVELIICVTHRCGVAVEAAGLSLYSCGTLALCRISDVPGLTQDLRRALQWGRGWAGAVAEQLVSAARWARDALQVALALTLAALSAGARGLRHGAHRLSGDRGRRCWSALQSSRVWRKLSDLSASVTGCFCRGGSAAGRSDDGSPSRAAPGEELRRLLALAQVPEDELDPFSVLGVDVQASEAELKRAYRQLAVQVHPDKNKHPGAGEAFKVLRAAWDIVSNPETRREYELKRMAATELSKSMNEFLTKLQDDLKEAMNTMMCTKCEGKHRRFEMDREPAAARFCGECKRWHGAEEGDLWAESSLMGLRITYFAFMDGKVFDITEWAGCQRISISPDTHRVPYHISFGSKGSSGPSRHRSASEASAGGSPADLQDFFSRFFQSGSSSETPANGGFFPAGGAPHTGFFPAAGAHGPGPAGASMFTGAPPQTGVFSGVQRAEAGEHCAEGRAPRRRRKVRKPFQR